MLCKSYYQVRLVQNSPDALYSLSRARVRRFCQFCLHSALIMCNPLIIKWLRCVGNVQNTLHLSCTRGTGVSACTWPFSSLHFCAGNLRMRLREVEFSVTAGRHASRRNCFRCLCMLCKLLACASVDRSADSFVKCLHS